MSGYHLLQPETSQFQIRAPKKDKRTSDNTIKNSK